MFNLVPNGVQRFDGIEGRTQHIMGHALSHSLGQLGKGQIEVVEFVGEVPAID